MARGLLSFRVVHRLSILVFAVGLGLAACGSGDDGDGGTPQPDASTTGTIQFMEMCDLTDDQCDRSERGDMICFGFNNKGPHCTHPCDLDDDCAAPSPGCNNMGVCKAPD